MNLFWYNFGNICSIVHDHLLHLVYPDLLCAVGETSYGVRVGFIGSTYCLHSLFIYVVIYFI